MKKKTPPATLSFRFPPQGGGLRGSFSAFTLVELIVSITLSIILMTSIGIFVTDGVKNISLQKKIVENNEKFNNFTDILNDTVDSSRYVLQINSGVLFKLEKSYDKGGFAYIGEKSFTGIYCSGTSNDNTKHLIIKTFIPFESTNSDVFSGGYNYDDGTYKTSFFSGIISKSGISFTGNYFGATDLVFGAGNDMYVSDTLNHTVLKFDKTNTNILPQIVAGKSGIFGNDTASGTIGTGISLNNPTGLAFGNNILFVADTLNDRILYLSGGIAYTLLDRYDSLREPTGIYFDSTSKTLYISNSGNGEILVYSGGLDSNIFTKSNNMLKVLASGLSYPTGISLIGRNVKFLDFLDRKIKTINATTGAFISSTNLNSFSFSNFAYNKVSDFLLETPIKSLDLDFTNNLFSGILKYYKNYSCNNPNENIERTYLMKKYLK